MSKSFQLSIHLVVKGKSIQDLGKLFEMIEDLIDEFDVCELVEMGGGVVEAQNGEEES